jgi:hypothetical protein
MTRRVLPLLLAALVITGITAQTCPPWRCPTLSAPAAPAAEHHAMHHDVHAAGAHFAAQASAHDCCDRQGLTKPPCCPELQVGPGQSSATAGRASDFLQLAATQPAPFVLVVPALVRRDTPRRFDPGAPPGTLIEQHTSLLV